jgi:hypothetical protein
MRFVRLVAVAFLSVVLLALPTAASVQSFYCISGLWHLFHFHSSIGSDE